MLETLFAADGPVSAEYVARRAQISMWHLCYRNFEMLERHGLVRHVHLGHGPGLYALRGRGEREYLYCERCGAVKALQISELDALRQRISEHYGYQTRFNHFAIVGTCAECSTHTVQSTDRRPTSERERAGMDESYGSRHQHAHEHPHSHKHEHADGVVHEHAHSGHDHQHVEHEHEHSHGDHVHAHPHVHEQGLKDRHEHGH